MATSYTDVYTKFVTMFKDSTLSNLTQPTLDGLFDLWLDESCSIHFKESRTDLLDRDEGLRQFNQTLTSEEQWIVCYGMQLSWLDSKIYDYEGKFKNKFQDRDFKTFSPANMLTALKSTREQTACKLSKARRRYGKTYDYMTSS